MCSRLICDHRRRHAEGDLAAMTTTEPWRPCRRRSSRRPERRQRFPEPVGSGFGVAPGGRTPGQRAPAQPPHRAAAGRLASVAAAPVEVHQRYLAPALKRRRRPGRAPRASARRPGRRPRGRRTRTRDDGCCRAGGRRPRRRPARQPASQPALAHELQIARIAAALMTSGGSEPRSMIPPAASAPASRGLSVAEAARVSGSPSVHCDDRRPGRRRQ